MAQEHTIKLLIQKHTETNADGQTDLINWGASTLSTQNDIMTLTEEYQQKTNNLHITFQEIEVDDEPTSFEKIFNKTLQELAGQLKRINALTVFLVTVGKVTKEKIELLPKEGGFDGLEFLLDGPTYYQSKEMEWYPLGIGDEIEVSLNPFNLAHGRRITCTVQRVVERHSSYYEEYHKKQRSNRMNKDFTCMAGHAIVYVKTEDIIELQSNDENKKRKAIVSFQDIRMDKYINKLHRYPKKILGDIEQTGAKYRTWIFPTTNRENQKDYFLSIHSTDNFDKGDPIRQTSDIIIDIVGTVCDLETDENKSILWISSEDGKYHNNAFKSDIGNKEDNFSTSSEIAKKWGKIIRDYLPLGFPATFTLDPEIKTGKTKIKLRGLLPGLHGRVSSDREASDAITALTKPENQGKKKRRWCLCKNNLMTPYQLDGEQVLFTSEGYTGYGDRYHIPSALMEYAKEGLFSTEVKIPANVWRDGDTIRINVNTALADEFQRLQSIKGQKEDMKICWIMFGKILLTTSGGYPVVYTCHNEDEEETFRSRMFMNIEMCISDINDDQIVVKRPSSFPAKVRLIHIGDYFPAQQPQVDKDGRWTARKRGGYACRILPILLMEGEHIKEGDNLQLLDIDYEKEQLVAVARPDRITIPTAKQTLITTQCQLTKNNWLCTTNEGQYAIMRTTSMENIVLHHLQHLYGEKIPVMVKPLNDTYDNGAATCCFDGKACGADYSRLLSGESMPLQVALSQDTRKVFYHDIVISATADELANGPMQWIIPTDSLDANGCIICKRGVAPDVSKYMRKKLAEQQINMSQGTMAEVIEVNSSNIKEQFLKLKVESQIYRLTSEEQLHIPLRKFLLSAVFQLGQKWQVKISGGQCQLNNEAPKRATEYSLITKSRKFKKNDWVVRSNDGRIGVAENIDNAIQGDKRYMIFSEYDHDYTLLEEGEQNLTGQKIALILDNQTPDGFNCHQVGSEKHFIINKEHWNWVSTRLTLNDTNVLSGTAFLARILNFDEGKGTADRRCLLPQCELVKGDTVSEGVYQMSVVGYNTEGYLLEQNKVRALLPWNEAAMFFIDSNDKDIVEGYLPVRSLITVKLHTQAGSNELQAEWRTLHKNIFQMWHKKAEEQIIQNATIHHINHDHAFLMLDNTLIHLTASQLGLWEGQMLEEHYTEGDIIENCVIKWDSKHDCYTFAIENNDDKNDNILPTEHQIYDGHLLRYDNHDCYVEFGPQGCWVAKVLGSDLSWVPFPEGEPPYKVGDPVKIYVSVVSINTDIGKKIIHGSIRHTLPKPTKGPSVGQVELHRYTKVKQNMYTKLYLIDEDGKPAILDQDNAIEPLKDIVEQIEARNYPWLPVNNIVDSGGPCYSISQKVMADKIFELQQIVKEQRAIKVRILEVRANRLVVSYEGAIGSIEKKEATGQIIAPLKSFYSKGQEVECAIMNVDASKASFKASVLMYRGLKNMIGITVNSKTQVTLIEHKVDTGQVKVITDNHYIGFIPREEVNDSDFDNWATHYMGEKISVVCINIDTDSGILTFSRRRCLAEGVTDLRN